MTTLLRTKIKHPEKSVIDMSPRGEPGTAVYPVIQKGDDQIIEVTDDAHAELILKRAPEGFEPYDEKKAKKSTPAAAKTTTTDTSETEAGSDDSGTKEVDPAVLEAIAAMDKDKLLDFATKNLPNLKLNDKAPIPALRSQVKKALEAKASA